MLWGTQKIDTVQNRTVTIYKNYLCEVLCFSAFLLIGYILNLNIYKFVLSNSIGHILNVLAIVYVFSREPYMSSNGNMFCMKLLEILMIWALCSAYTVSNHSVYSILFKIVTTVIHLTISNSCAIYMVDRIGRMPTYLKDYGILICLAVSIYILMGFSFYSTVTPLVKIGLKFVIQLIMYFQMIFNNVYIIQKTKSQMTVNEVCYSTYLLISSTINHLVMLMLY